MQFTTDYKAMLTRIFPTDVTGAKADKGSHGRSNNGVDYKNLHYNALHTYTITTGFHFLIVCIYYSYNCDNWTRDVIGIGHVSVPL
jgi:hypothetical protein